MFHCPTLGHGIFIRRSLRALSGWRLPREPVLGLRVVWGDMGGGCSHLGEVTELASLAGLGDATIGG